MTVSHMTTFSSVFQIWINWRHMVRKVKNCKPNWRMRFIMEVRNKLVFFSNFTFFCRQMWQNALRVAAVWLEGFTNTFQCLCLSQDHFDVIFTYYTKFKCFGIFRLYHQSHRPDCKLSAIWATSVWSSIAKRLADNPVTTRWKVDRA